MRSSSSQSQEGGDSSINLQSQGDITFVQNGLSVPEAIDIARNVAIGEISKYEAEARVAFSARVAQMSEEIVDRIVELGQDRLSAFSDPDVQGVVREAITGYGRVGREDVKRTLVDLVAQRCLVESGTVEAVTVTQAVDTVRRLSKTGISVLTLHFVLDDVFNAGINSIVDLSTWVTTNCMPFLIDLDSSSSEAGYLASIGCASDTGVLSRSLVALVKAKYPGLFQFGTPREELVEQFPELQGEFERLFTWNLRERSLLQIAALNERAADSRLDDVKFDVDDELRGRYKGLLRVKLLDDKTIEEILRDYGEPWPRLLDVWTPDSILSRMDLTAVGMAIGHSNWTRSVGVDVPLSVWIK